MRVSVDPNGVNFTISNKSVFDRIINLYSSVLYFLVETCARLKFERIRNGNDLFVTRKYLSRFERMAIEY